MQTAALATKQAVQCYMRGQVLRVRLSSGGVGSTLLKSEASAKRSLGLPSKKGQLGSSLQVF